MTIKLLTPYNDYPAGARLSRDLVFESTMVDTGKATFDLAGSFQWPKESTDEILGPFSSALVLEAAYPAAKYTGFTALVGEAAPYTVYFSDGQTWLVKMGGKTNPLTGGFGISAGGKRITALVTKQVAQIKPLGFPNLSGSANVTRQGAMVLPFLPFAVKARVFNADTAAAKTMRAGIALASSIADDVGNALTWTPFTFSGAATVSVGMATGVSPNFVFGVAESDLLYIDPVQYGGKGTVAFFRTHALETQNLFYPWSSGVVGDMTLAKIGCSGRFQAGVEAVSNAALFTASNAHNSLPPIELLFYPKEQVKTIAVFGSSASEGIGDSVYFGWAERTRKILNSMGGAYSFAMHSVGGATSQAALARAIVEITANAPDVAVLQSTSPNDSDAATAAGLARYKSQAAYFVSFCSQRGVRPVLLLLPVNTAASAAVNDVRREVNQFCKDMELAGTCEVIDMPSVLSVEVPGAVGSWIDVADTVEGTHLTPSGHVKAAAIAAPVLA